MDLVLDFIIASEFPLLFLKRHPNILTVNGLEMSFSYTGLVLSTVPSKFVKLLFKIYTSALIKKLKIASFEEI